MRETFVINILILNDVKRSADLICGPKRGSAADVCMSLVAAYITSHLTIN